MGESFLIDRSLRVSAEALADFFPGLWEFRLRSRRGHRRYLPTTDPPAERRAPAHPYRGWRRLWFETYFATMPVHKWLIRRSARDSTSSSRRPSGCRVASSTRCSSTSCSVCCSTPTSTCRTTARRCTPPAYTRTTSLARRHRPHPAAHEDAVRRHLYFKLFADNHRKREMLKVTTSGSTGEPFTTYADRHQLEVRFATTLRGLEWTGWRFGDRQARLWHQTIGMTKLQVLRERIDAWFMRRLFIPAFEIDADNIEDFIGPIREHKPVLVDGYAESLNFLATYVREGGRPGFSPKAMMSSAQALPTTCGSSSSTDSTRRSSTSTARASSRASPTSAATRPITT